MISNDPIVRRSSIQDLGWRSCPSSTSPRHDRAERQLQMKFSEEELRIVK
ncbi:MAG TPA: hypothetical protein VHJ59_06615 [Nitrososphaera sp.]|nr:hypothetical protein [Nitrososphaera sp.]